MTPWCTTRQRTVGDVRRPAISEISGRGGPKIAGGYLNCETKISNCKRHRALRDLFRWIIINGEDSFDSTGSHDPSPPPPSRQQASDSDSGSDDYSDSFDN